ncbi:hypothetical protein D9M68_823990 [compost metagenome]
MDQHAFRGLLSGHVHDLLRRRPARANDAPFETELARLLDDQAGRSGGVSVKLDCVNAARHHAGQQGHEIDPVALEEFLRRQRRARLLVGSLEV